MKAIGILRTGQQRDTLGRLKLILVRVLLGNIVTDQVLQNGPQSREQGRE